MKRNEACEAWRQAWRLPQSYVVGYWGLDAAHLSATCRGCAFIEGTELKTNWRGPMKIKTRSCSLNTKCLVKFIKKKIEKVVENG